MSATLDTVRSNISQAFRYPGHEALHGKSYYTIQGANGLSTLEVNPTVQQADGTKQVEKVKFEFPSSSLEDPNSTTIFSLIESWFHGCPSILQTIKSNPVESDGVERESMPFGDGHFLTWGPLAPSYIIQVKKFI